jgi:hypoxanthine phosphoribosyltransferase
VRSPDVSAESPPVLIPEETILARVADLAAEISRDYAQVPELLLVGVLRGAFIFLADLSRRLIIPRRVEFVSLSKYADGTRTDGDLGLVMDLRCDVRDQHVLIVEDIVDTGRTLRHLLDTLAQRSPASLKCCALVQKPDRLEVAVPIHYLGFNIPDVWAVGYGLDFAGRHRTLPYIGTVHSDESP